MWMRWGRDVETDKPLLVGFLFTKQKRVEAERAVSLPEELNFEILLCSWSMQRKP